MLRGVEEIQGTRRIPKAVFPVTGGLAVGLAALAYPEILYWGFQNVDILLESRPFVKGLSADLLIQIVGVKILATSFCRASGLVGGYYAPSLFIGAGTGMAYGKLIAFAVSQSHPIFQAPWFEVASPQAYALVNIILLFPCVSSFVESRRSHFCTTLSNIYHNGLKQNRLMASFLWNSSQLVVIN